MDALRISLAETEVLSTLTTAAYDSADWGDADPAVVDRIGTLLGLIEKSATAALAAFHRLHGAVADAQPAPAGEAWDYSDGTAPGGEPADAASAPEDEPAVAAHDAEIVRCLRERCAAQLERPVDYPFFVASYLAGEEPDAALLRLFRRNRQVLGRTDRPVPPRRRLGQRAHHGAAHRTSARLHHRGRIRRGRRRAGSGSRDAVAAHPLSASGGPRDAGRPTAPT